MAMNHKTLPLFDIKCSEIRRLMIRAAAKSLWIQYFMGSNGLAQS